MDGLIDKDEHKKKEVEIDEQEKEEMAGVLVKQMINTSLRLNDKSKQCQFSPVMFQVAQAIWSTSNSACKEMVSLMPMCFPGMSQLQKNKTVACVKDGKM